MKWLDTQILKFGSTEDENMLIWTQRVDRIAQIHRATDDVTRGDESLNEVRALVQNPDRRGTESYYGEKF